MAETKEQLKIQAELDTSKLKQDAKNGLNSVSNETKKLENDARSAGRVIDSIGTSAKGVGNAMASAGSQATSALKTVSSEAKNASSQVDNLAKSVKNINFKQTLGMVNQALPTLAPVGRAMGKALGMSDDQIGVAGGLVSGAMSGAMAGSAAGPWGAVIGGLAGAGASLLKAGEMLQKNAQDELQKSQANQKKEETRKENEEFLNKTANATPDQLAKMLLDEIQIKNEIQRQIDTNYSDDSTGLTGRGLVENLKKQNANYDKLEQERLISEERIRIIRSRMGEVGNSLVSGNVPELKTAEENRQRNLATLANISESEKFANENENISQSVLAGGADTYARLSNEYSQRLEEVTQKLNDSVGNQDEFNKLMKERNRLLEKSKIVETAYNEVVAKAEQAEQDAIKARETRQREQYNLIANGMKDSASTLTNGLGGMKLTDSLTRIGGGTGYATQMTGINKVVSDINENVASILKELQKNFNQNGTSQATF